MDYSKLEPGRELDAIVAREVIEECSHNNNKKIESDDEDHYYWKIICLDCNLILESSLTNIERYCPHYSTSIADAWLVVEKMHSMGYWTNLIGNNPDYDNKYIFIITVMIGDEVDDDPFYQSSASAPSLAICRAALAAIESRET